MMVHLYGTCELGVRARRFCSLRVDYHVCDEQDFVHLSVSIYRLSLLGWQVKSPIGQLRIGKVHNFRVRVLAGAVLAGSSSHDFLKHPYGVYSVGSRRKDEWLANKNRIIVVFDVSSNDGDSLSRSANRSSIPKRVHLRQ
jgi:hypothetical protein